MSSKKTVTYWEILNKSHCDPEMWPYIAGYAFALNKLMHSLTGDSPSGKSYDPMLVTDTGFHSYAFDMKDGSRRHPFSDYKNVEDVFETLTKEAIEWIKEDE